MIFSLLVLAAILMVSIPLMIIMIKTVWHRKLPVITIRRLIILLHKQKKSFTKRKMNEK